MNLIDKLKAHWLGGCIGLAAICIGSTWLIASEILVKPRDLIIEQHMAEIQKIRANLHDLKDRQDKLADDSAITAKFDRIRKEYENLQVIYQNLRKASDKSFEENKKLLSELAELRKNRKKVEDNNKSLNSEISRLKGRLAKLEKLDLDNQRRSALITSIATLEKKKEQLKVNIAREFAELQRIRSSAESFQEQCELCKSISKLCNQEEMKSVCSKAAEFRGLTHEKREEVEWLRKESKILGDQIHNLQDKL